MLLGGLNVVRALGLGGIPAIVASPCADAPALASRYAQGRIHLPPLERPDAVPPNRRGAGKARVFATGPEITALPLARQLREELVLQEYVPGDDRHLWSFHGYADENGVLLASFVGRKIRTYPPLTGVSSYVELAHDDAFAFVGSYVAARVPLRGVFKIDFKQDAVSGAWRKSSRPRSSSSASAFTS